MGIYPARPQEALIAWVSGSALHSSPVLQAHASTASMAWHWCPHPKAGRFGSDGLIVHGPSGAWTQVASPTDQTLWSVGMVSPTEGWAVGDQGTILHYQNGAWSPYQGW